MIGSNSGFFLNGEQPFDFFGSSVSNAGDFNGDGIDDFIIGAYRASPRDIEQAGRTFVLFGGQIYGSNGTFELDQLNGSNGFVFNGIQSSEHSGRSVSYAGDVNGDGIADLLIGAPNFGYSGRENCGSTFVVFGSKSLGSNGTFELSSINGSNGFVLIGEQKDDQSGWSVSQAGDFDGDGIDDLLIGAPHASPSGMYRAGKAYLVFGSKGLGKNGKSEPIKQAPLGGQVQEKLMLYLVVNQ